MTCAKNGITLKPALPIAAHAALVMAWRNDEITRRMSFHTEPKIWASFLKEFQDTYFCAPQLPPLFAMQAEQPIAWLRFRPISKTSNDLEGTIRQCDISIIVAPDYRGQGLASTVLFQALRFLKNHNIETVIAEIRTENRASQAVFEKAGFCWLESTVRIIDDTGEHCSIFRYQAILNDLFDDG